MIQSNIEDVRKAVIEGRSPRALEVMKVPKSLCRLRKIESAQSDEAMQALRAGRNVFLSGIPGSGKSHIAVTLMQEWLVGRIALEDGVVVCREGYPRFVVVAELLLEIQSAWSRSENVRGESTKKMLDRYTAVPMLVLDDLGAEQVSDWSRGIMVLLVDRCLREGKQIVVTSNLSLQRIANEIDARIASRLSDGMVIKMADVDWRRRQSLSV